MKILTFILSELVHMSEMLRVTEEQIESEFGPEMEDQAEIEFDDTTTAQIEEEASGYDPISEEPLDSPSEELEDVSPPEPEYERGSTDLLGRLRGLGIEPDPYPPH